MMNTYPKRLIEVDLPIKRISKQKLDETKSALRELGMNDDINLS
jgi:hypothetical protein